MLGVDGSVTFVAMAANTLAVSGFPLKRSFGVGMKVQRRNKAAVFLQLC